jgi:hypothetical protein
MDQEFLNFYFREIWKPSTDVYSHSSYQKIAETISDLDLLLDVGCGVNPFKQLVKNVIGIDPARDEADYKTTLESFYYKEKFTVATCLGSINFGDENIIADQISKLVSLMADQSRIFWRLNPGRNDHKNQHCEKIIFFPWSFSKLNKFAEKHGYVQSQEFIESNKDIMRLYAEWRKV